MSSKALITVALLVGTSVPSVALTGREVIDTAQQKNGFSTWHDRITDMTMDTYRCPDTTCLEREREVTITEQTHPRGEHRTFMEFTAPADVTGTLFLHLSPRGEPDQQWLWTTSTRKARRLADANRDENFMGTDLSYRDIELIVRIQQWNDDEATATLAPEEAKFDDKPCHLVTLVPKDTKEFPYTRYRLWFGTADLLLWQVEVDNEDGKLFKRVRFSHYDRIQDFATAKEADVATIPYSTHTAYKLRSVRYNTDVSDNIFSVSNIQKGR